MIKIFRNGQFQYLWKYFSKKKLESDNFSQVSRTKTDREDQTNIQKIVEIQQKYQQKSAKLFDKYLESRQKPYLTLDDHQIHYSLILQRLPIFIPYQKRTFQNYKNRYKIIKKAGFFLQLPSQLSINQIQTNLQQFNERHPQNIITHVKSSQNSPDYTYSQHSRYWKNVDPDIEDTQSVQAYSTQNVFFLVKKNGQWKFPSRAINLNQSHQKFFQNFTKELFPGTKNPSTFITDRKPIYAMKYPDQSLDRGIGILNLFFKGINKSGIPDHKKQLYQEHAWVPKAYLHKYLSQQYYKQIIRSIIHKF